MSQKGTWREWLLFFARGMATQARDALRRSKVLLDLQQDYRRRLQRPRASTLPLQLIDELFGMPVLTIPRAQQKLGVTYRAAQLNVEKLVQARILREITGDRHVRLFVATELLAALDEPFEERSER